MATQLNLKDAETNARIAELARLTGVSKTRAVRMAVDAAIAAREADWDRRIAEAERLTAQIRADWGEPLPTTEQVFEELYGDDGLPQ